MESIKISSDLVNALGLNILDVWNNEAIDGIDSNADVVSSLVGDVFTFLVNMSVQDWERMERD